MFSRITSSHFTFITLIVLGTVLLTIGLVQDHPNMQAHPSPSFPSYQGGERVGGVTTAIPSATPVPPTPTPLLPCSPAPLLTSTPTPMARFRLGANVIARSTSPTPSVNSATKQSPPPPRPSPVVTGEGSDRLGKPTISPQIEMYLTSTVTSSPTLTLTPRLRSVQASTPTATPTPTHTPTPSGPPPASAPPDRIVIPAIELDVPVVPVGWTDTDEGPIWDVADYAAGWHETSAYPGHIGNTVLSGHHNIKGEVFRYLIDLELGDEVFLYVGETAYRYVVVEKHLLEEKGMSEEVRRSNAQWIAPTDDERLTLVTCWPYTSNTHRLIIVARKLAIGD